jgi:hypothetical protein
LIERLEREHRELDPKLDHVLELSESGNLRVAESILLSISQAERALSGNPIGTSYVGLRAVSHVRMKELAEQLKHGIEMAREARLSKK